jgi:hypothetical protein
VGGQGVQGVTVNKADVIAPIANVVASTPMVLDSRSDIRAMTPQMYGAMQAGWKQRLIRHPSAPTCCLYVRDVALQPGDEGTSAKDAIEELVLRLRIFKAGAVSFDFGVIDSGGWYENPTEEKATHLALFGVFFYVPWAHHGMPVKFEVEPSEAESLRSFVTLTESQHLMDRPAYRYFFQSYHEPYATDRFLKNAIGLENLLVSDAKDTSNIRYKFVDRGCFLLNRAKPHSEGASGYTKPLSDIYDARSRLVHASKSPPTRSTASVEERDRLLRSEDYLRVLLRYLLEHPELDTAESIDSSKRQLYR